MSIPAPARVLLVGGDAVLAAALSSAGYDLIHAAEDADFYALVEREQPDAVVVASDSPTRDGLEHLALLSRKHPQPVLLFHDGSDQALAQRAMRAGVTAYVRPELSAPTLRSLIEVATLHFEQTRSLRQELTRAQKARADRELIDAAKCRLMETQGLSEHAAYKILQARAMNQRRTLTEIAHELLARPLR